MDLLDNMAELLHNLIHPLPNAIMSVLVGLLILYWVLTLISGIGPDFLDLDTDTDFDLSEPGFFASFFSFLNIGKIPFMLFCTIYIVFIWVGSLIITSIFKGADWGALSVLILIPLACLSVFLTKIATTPMIKFFKEIGYKGEEEIDFLGRSGRMTSTIQGDKIGTAEFLIDKNPIRLNVKSIEGKELKYNDYVIIVDESSDRKYYLVNKEISLRNL